MCCYFATLWTVACQALLSMEFSRQEYWVASSRPRDRAGVSCVSCTGRGILYHYAPWEAPAIANKRVTLWFIPTMGIWTSQSWVVSFHLKGITGSTFRCSSFIPSLHGGLCSDDPGLGALVGWRGSKIWFWCGDWWYHMWEEGLRRCVTHNEHVWESRTEFGAGLKWFGEQGGAVGRDFDGGWALSWSSPCIVWASHQSPRRQHLAFLPVSPDVSQKGSKERWGCKAIRSLTSTVDAALLSDHHFAPPDFILKVYSSDYCFSD